MRIGTSAKPDQPFFARITFGGTHRSWNRDPERPIDIKDVELPPYYADTPLHPPRLGQWPGTDADSSIAKSVRC